MTATRRKKVTRRDASAVSGTRGETRVTKKLSSLRSVETAWRNSTAIQTPLFRKKRPDVLVLLKKHAAICFGASAFVEVKRQQCAGTADEKYDEKFSHMVALRIAYDIPVLMVFDAENQDPQRIEELRRMVAAKGAGFCTLDELTDEVFEDIISDQFKKIAYQKSAVPLVDLLDGLCAEFPQLDVAFEIRQNALLHDPRYQEQLRLAV